MNFLILSIYTSFTLLQWSVHISHDLKVFSIGSLPDFFIIQIQTDTNYSDLSVSLTGVIIYIMIILLLSFFANLYCNKQNLRKATNKDLLHCFLSLILQSFFIFSFYSFSMGMPIPYFDFLYPTFGKSLIYLTVFGNAIFWIGFHILKLKFTGKEEIENCNKF